MVKLACSSRCAQPFPLNHSCSKDNQAFLPGPLCNSSQKRAMFSMQAARWMKELKVVQEAWSWCPLPMWANFLHQPTKRILLWIQSRDHHSIPILFLSRLRKVFGLRVVAKGLPALMDKWFFILQLTLAFSFGVLLKARKGMAHLSPPHHVLQQGLAQVNQFFSEPVVLQVRHT